jgi:hypothetical protein
LSVAKTSNDDSHPICYPQLCLGLALTTTDNAPASREEQEKRALSYDFHAFLNGPSIWRVFAMRMIDHGGDDLFLARYFLFHAMTRTARPYDARAIHCMIHLARCDLLSMRMRMRNTQCRKNKGQWNTKTGTLSEETKRKHPEEDQEEDQDDDEGDEGRSRMCHEPTRQQAHTRTAALEWLQKAHAAARELPSRQKELENTILDLMAPLLVATSKITTKTQTTSSVLISPSSFSSSSALENQHSKRKLKSKFEIALEKCQLHPLSHEYIAVETSNHGVYYLDKDSGECMLEEPLGYEKTLPGPRFKVRIFTHISIHSI